MKTLFFSMTYSGRLSTSPNAYVKQPPLKIVEHERVLADIIQIFKIFFFAHFPKRLLRSLPPKPLRSVCNLGQSIELPFSSSLLIFILVFSSSFPLHLPLLRFFSFFRVSAITVMLVMTSYFFPFQISR